MPLDNRESELKEWKRKEAEKAILRIELSNPSLKKEDVQNQTPNFLYKLKKIFTGVATKNSVTVSPKKETVNSKPAAEIPQPKIIAPEPAHKMFYQNPTLKAKPVVTEVANLKNTVPSRPIMNNWPSTLPVVKPEIKNEIKPQLKFEPQPSKKQKDIELKPIAEGKKPILNEPNFQPAKNNFDINLIPADSAKNISDKKNIKNFFVIILITILFCAGVYVPLYSVANKKENTAKQLEKETENVITETKKIRASSQEINAFVDILQEIKKIIEGHVYAEKIFVFLETNTLKTVYYSNLQFNYDAKTINLIANAKDYHALAEQILVFQNLDMIEKVDISAVTLGKAEPVATAETAKPRLVTFNLSLKIKPDFLLKK